MEGESKKASKVMLTAQDDKYWGDGMGNIVYADGDALSQEGQRRVNVRKCLNFVK